MVVTTLLKLAGFTNALSYVGIAHQALVQMQGMLAQYPLGFGQWLQVLAYALSKPREIAIVGEPDATDTQVLLSVVRSSYRPFRVVALGAPGAQPPDVPLLQDQGLVEGYAAAYVCAAPSPGRALSEATGFACRAPLAEPVS